MYVISAYRARIFIFLTRVSPNICKRCRLNIKLLWKIMTVHLRKPDSGKGMISDWYSKPALLPDQHICLSAASDPRVERTVSRSHCTPVLSFAGDFLHWIICIQIICFQINKTVISGGYSHSFREYIRKKEKKKHYISAVIEDAGTGGNISRIFLGATAFRFRKRT